MNIKRKLDTSLINTQETKKFQNVCNNANGSAIMKNQDDTQMNNGK